MLDIISSILNCLLEMTGGVFDALFGFVGDIISPTRKTEYDAGFAHPSDVGLSTRNKGFTFGHLSLDLRLSFRNSILYGMTGAGKNVAVLVNSILRMAGPSNMIIHDPSKTLWQLCSGFLRMMGYEIIILNYLEPMLGGWNPLNGIEINDVSAIQKICKLLIHNTLGHGKEPFWNLAAENFLKVLIQIVLGGPPETRTMCNVLALCNRFAFSPEDLDLLVIQCKNDTLLSEYKTFLKYDTKMVMSILASVKAALNLWADTDVALCTSYDTMRMDEWRTMKFCLFIQSSVPLMRYHSPVTSLFFDQAFGRVMSDIPSSDAERPIFFLIDECSSLYIELLSITYSNIRKYKGGVMSVFQSPFQLQQIYSAAGAKAIEDNAYSKLYMPGVDIQVATQLEQTLGKFEYVDDKGVRHVRPLMLSSEIRESKHSLLFTGNNRVVKIDLRPFFKQPKLLKMTKILPALPQNSAPFVTPPMIQFD
jgi:type IV secretory pathway TraG/TraD family ATPase VirD4